MSNLASHEEGVVKMNSKKQKRLVITRKLMDNAKERIDLSSELEQDLENLGLQRRMKQLELESKFLKNQNNELL
jgi:diketogulonate reductase-like aldo/keto reductase